MTSFTSPPPNFSPVNHISACFIESDGHVLYLKRAPGRSFAETWCLPAGKIEPFEDPRTAAIREVSEETGLNVDSPNLQFLATLYFRAETDYVFHVFSMRFATRPSPILNPEHTQFTWTADPSTLPLIPGSIDAFHLYKRLTS